jgi:hypothetical protein
MEIFGSEIRDKHPGSAIMPGTTLRQAELRLFLNCYSAPLYEYFPLYYSLMQQPVPTF